MALKTMWIVTTLLNPEASIEKYRFIGQGMFFETKEKALKRIEENRKHPIIIGEKEILWKTKFEEVI